MKKSLLFILTIFFSIACFSQNAHLVQANDKGLYINHTVNPKEGFYSIGRIYRIHPKEIAAFNGIDINTGLSIGQTLMVPLTAGNFSQAASSGTPVYYMVGDKEGLYRVSTKHNNVLMANLRKWNNLSSDELNPGQKLIVGYITTDGNVNTSVATAPVIQQPIIKEKKEETVVQPPEVTKIEPKKKSIPSAPTQAALKDAAGGYFKTSFDQQSRTSAAGKDQTATAGIFKTASGWQDMKYYALMDGVDPGTIVRVINPSNSKAIYAKVLGAMSGISQNKGLDVRISNAAASVLDINDTEKFIVRVNY
jgi:LysM repeat protein